jgi:sugar lactone lactonase YvrE
MTKTLRALLPFTLLMACSDPADPPATDGGATDAGTPADTGMVAQDSGPGDAGNPMSACGTARPDVSAIRGTEGLVIARDGTIYYSRPRAVGRLRPGGEPEPAWAMLPSGASTVWGMVIDPANNRLYVGSPSATTVYAVTLGDTPEVTPYVSGAGQPNGLTLGPDGALYYSDFGGGRVYRVPPGGERAQVTMSAIAQANGVAFGPDGALYVCSYGAGTLVRLTLADGVETERAVFARSLGNPDGVAFDRMGRVYVTDNGMGRVLRLDPDGSNPTPVQESRIGAAASLDFGVGALNCSDLYVASSGAMVRIETDAPGADVPWHR